MLVMIANDCNGDGDDNDDDMVQWQWHNDDDGDDNDNDDDCDEDDNQWDYWFISVPKRKDYFWQSHLKASAPYLFTIERGSG